MKRLIFCLLLLFIVPIAYAVEAKSGEISADYLHGNWALGSNKQCNSADKEYFIFRANGTFENGRKGKTEVTGFWHVDGFIVQLHMVTSPGFFVDSHELMKGYQDQFIYMPAKLVTTDVQKDSFDGVGVLGKEIDKATFFRCK